MKTKKKATVRPHHHNFLTISSEVVRSGPNEGLKVVAKCKICGETKVYNFRD